MNALSQIKEATKVASRSWFAIARQTTRGLEPFICDGDLAAIPGHDLAHALARVYDAYVVPLGMSALPPDLARYREVMALPDSRSTPVGFDIIHMDPWKEQQQYQSAQGVGSDSAWGR